MAMLAALPTLYGIYGVFYPSVAVRLMAAQETDAAASITLNSDGTITYFGAATPNYQRWGRGISGANYECRMATISGVVDSGVVDSWVPLSSPVTWRLTAASNAGVSSGGIGSGALSGASQRIVNFSGVLSVRRASDQVVVQSREVTLEAEASYS